jgi:hypothetical protein
LPGSLKDSLDAEAVEGVQHSSARTNIDLPTAAQTVEGHAPRVQTQNPAAVKIDSTATTTAAAVPAAPAPGHKAAEPTLRGTASVATAKLQPGPASPGEPPTAPQLARTPNSAPDLPDHEPQIPMHSGWVTLKNIEGTDKGFKVFRRYALGTEQTPLANLMMFKCSKDVTKAASHLVFVLPKDFQPDSFPRDTWLPKMSVRFVIDDQRSVSLPAEYRAGEFFLDWNSGTDEDFRMVMLSDNLAMGFGDKNDIVRLQFTEKMDALFSEVNKKVDTGLGAITHYQRAGTGEFLMRA